MKVHIFQSGRRPDVFGFTSDATGGNLPVEFAPWTCAGVGAMEIDPGAGSAGIGEVVSPRVV
jgi:hypothetical protein